MQLYSSYCGSCVCCFPLILLFLPMQHTLARISTYIALLLLQSVIQWALKSMGFSFLNFKLQKCPSPLLLMLAHYGHCCYCSYRQLRSLGGDDGLCQPSASSLLNLREKKEENQIQKFPALFLLLLLNTFFEMSPGLKH